MIKLVLNPELVLTELKTWRDAVLLSRHRSTPYSDAESQTLAASMTGTAERVDGILVMLQSCSAAPEDQSKLAQLVAELRELRDWLHQGRYAAQVMQMLSTIGSRAPTQHPDTAHRMRLR